MCPLFDQKTKLNSRMRSRCNRKPKKKIRINFQRWYFVGRAFRPTFHSSIFYAGAKKKTFFSFILSGARNKNNVLDISKRNKENEMTEMKSLFLLSIPRILFTCCLEPTQIRTLQLFKVKFIMLSLGFVAFAWFFFLSLFSRRRRK